jgi:PAS domain-containing protein
MPSSHLRERLARKNVWGSSWVGIAAMAVLAVGIGSTLAVQKVTDERERQYLLNLAQTAATAIDPVTLQALTGSREDLSRPQYSALKEVLYQVRAASPDVRFAYLMGNRGTDKMFFFADSEPPTSEDHSDPGDVYEETTLAELDGFRQGKAFVEGPTSDVWGEWISAMAPVKDPSSGETLALIGMDIDTTVFNRRVFEAAVLPLSVTGGALIVLMGYWIYARRVRRAAEDVAQEREIFRVVLDDMPSGVIVAKYPSGEVVLENPQAWSLSERRDEHAHVSDYRFVDSQGKAYPPGEVPIAMTLANGERVVRDDLHVLRPGGNLRVRAESAPVRDAEGHVRFAVMVLTALD